MEFKIENLGEEGRGAKVEKRDETTLTLSVGFLGTHAGYAYLNRAQALALAGALKAIAGSLED